MSARRIFSELKRRRVFRVAAGYTVVGIAVAETLDLILPRLGAPDWVVTVFIVALLVGFPIALVLGWALEVTPEGIRVTDPVEDSGPDGEAPVRHGMAGYAMVFVLGAALSLGVWWLVGWEGDGGEDATTVRSLAVLPFSALSDESSDQWLAQGLHDQLITELAHLSGLDRVISRTSVLRFAEDPPSIIEIAQALNVDAIIEGTILPSTDRVRINVQLIDGVTDAHLWARDYDRAREEALDLVKSVAQDIAGEIALQLSATDEAHLQTERSVNPVAQEAYFRGRSFWNERTSEGMRQAAEQFQRAIDIDPDYGPAYAGMASLHALGWGGGDTALTEDYARWALELDPGLAEAYAALGFSKLFGSQAWDEAEEHFRTAVRLQPSFATAHQWGAELLAGRGRPEEAVEWIRRARELDPFSGIIAWNELRILYLAERYEKCLSANERYLAEFPDYSRPGNRLFCLAGAGRFSEAAEIMEAPDSVREAVAAGRVSELWEWMDQQPRWSGGWLPLAQLGRHDEFFERVDRFFEEGYNFGLNLTYVLADPLLKPMHQDPRWEEKVLRRVGLTQWPG